MSINENIHGVTELRMEKSQLKNSGRNILSLEIVFRLPPFFPTPERTTEKEIKLFLADDFEVKLENKCPNGEHDDLVDAIEECAQFPVFHDKKALLLSAQETLKQFKNDSDVAQYIAELHGRLLAADPSFSLGG
jgi:hypothetical protein